MLHWWRRQKQTSAANNSPVSKVVLSWLLTGFWGISGAIATGLDMERVQRWERQAQTQFFEVRGRLDPPPDIVILAIDDQSLAAAQTYTDDPNKKEIVRLMKSYPWNREAHAKAIAYLMAAGASAVALDILFDLPSGYGDEDDQRFAKTLAQYKDRVILAAAYNESAGPQGATLELSKPIPVLESAARLGLVNFMPPDVDGRARKLGSAFGEQILRNLKLQELPSFAEVVLQLAKRSYPKPKGDEVFFYGKPFKRIPFWQVLAPDWQQVFQREQTFKNKIVLVGTTTKSVASDFVRVPLTDELPGVELHANAIATLIEGRSIAEVLTEPWQRGVFVLLVVAAAGVLLSKLAKRPAWQLLFGLMVAAAVAVVGYLLFTYGYWIFPVAIPVGAIVLSSFSSFTFGVINDELEKLRLRRTLERYIAAPVVQQILRQPETMAGGYKLKAAVLFADIRGFTSLSYKLPPEELIQLLNRYFNIMVEEIIKAGGTVDKFIGDAVMAEFGFPVPSGEKQDALRAVRAALGMRRALVELRSQFLQEGHVPFFNGMGISFGEVIAGDLGSLQRREYGVIGDTVNIASRVEGLTKQFWTDILITDSLYQLVQEEVEVTYVGEQELRGREREKVKLYSLIGMKGEDQVLYRKVMEDLRQHLRPAPKVERESK